MPCKPDIEQFQGAVLGSAIGDAMGCPTEFLSKEQIHQKYGPEGVTEYVLFREVNNNKYAPYTDDTQMAEAVIRGLLEEHNNLDNTMQSIAKQFIQWESNPQGGHRAPGKACIEGCQNLAKGIHWSEAGGKRAGGCGSVMRTYPFALFFHHDIKKAERWAAKQSKLTHSDPIALAACAAMTVGMIKAIEKQPIDVILASMIEAAGRYSKETAFMLTKASQASATEEHKMTAWYEGWAAHEAIAISAFLFKIYYDQPQKAILAAINTSGDSDSIGALVGALVGAYQGIDMFPTKWLTQLERNKTLTELANQIHHTHEY